MLIYVVVFSILISYGKTVGIVVFLNKNRI